MSATKKTTTTRPTINVQEVEQLCESLARRLNKTSSILNLFVELEHIDGDSTALGVAAAAEFADNDLQQGVLRSSPDSGARGRCAVKAGAKRTAKPVPLGLRFIGQALGYGTKALAAADALAQAELAEEDRDHQTAPIGHAAKSLIGLIPGAASPDEEALAAIRFYFASEQAPRTQALSTPLRKSCRNCAGHHRRPGSCSGCAWRIG